MNLCFNNVSRTCIFPQKQSCSKAQPPFMWYEKVYAAMSNLAGESGMFVSGLLCCVLSFERTVSLHLLRELLTISTVDMVLLHSAQYIIFPLTSSYNSLCLACLKSTSFFSLSRLSAMSIFNSSFQSLSTHLCEINKSEP